MIENENERLYLRNDLEDHADDTISSVEDQYSRAAIMRELLPERADVFVYSTGGYQGTMGFVIRNVDGYVWVLKEGFGSCSYCDGLLGADNAADYGRSMMRNAYCFKDESDAVQFIEEMRENGVWGWHRVGEPLIEELQDR